jgi:hypothetical protein
MDHHGGGGARKHGVMVCISLDQEVAPSEGVALLE